LIQKEKSKNDTKSIVINFVVKPFVFMVLWGFFNVMYVLNVSNLNYFMFIITSILASTAFCVIYRKSQLRYNLIFCAIGSLICFIICMIISYFVIKILEYFLTELFNGIVDKIFGG
jgi:predicted membrane protein